MEQVGKATSVVRTVVQFGEQIATIRENVAVASNTPLCFPSINRRENSSQQAIAVTSDVVNRQIAFTSRSSATAQSNQAAQSSVSRSIGGQQNNCWRVCGSYLGSDEQFETAMKTKGPHFIDAKVESFRNSLVAAQMKDRNMPNAKDGRGNKGWDVLQPK